MKSIRRPFEILFYRWPWVADLVLTLLSLSPLIGWWAHLTGWVLIPWSIGGGCLAYATWWRPRHLVVRAHTLPFFPTPGTPLRVLFFSDIHLGPFKGRRFLRQLAHYIQTLAPDLILFGGDFFYSNQHPQYRPLLRDLSVITKLAPTYVIWGNHDIFIDHVQTRSEELLALLKEHLDTTGAHLLDNTAQDVTLRGRTLRLIGLADYLTQPPLPTILKLYDSPLPKIVLTHNPDLVAEYPLPPAALTLAGHTHGGQLCFPGLGPLPGMLPYRHHEFLCGQYRLPKTTLIVTAGAGESWLRLRWWCPPEIRVIDLTAQA